MENYKFKAKTEHQSYKKKMCCVTIIGIIIVLVIVLPVTLT